MRLPQRRSHRILISLGCLLLVVGWIDARFQIFAFHGWQILLGVALCLAWECIRRPIGWLLADARLMIVAGAVSAVGILLTGNIDRWPMAANESIAMSSLKSIQKAEEEFRSRGMKDLNKDGVSEIGTLKELAGMVPVKGTSDRVDPPMIDLELGSGIKSGYLYEVRNRQAADQTGVFACAYPVTYGKTGNRSFCIDETGVVRQTDCGGEIPDESAISGENPWVAVGE